MIINGLPLIALFYWSHVAFFLLMFQIIHVHVIIRASSYAERMHLRIAVIHGQKEAEPDYDDENYGRSSSPPPFIDEEPEEPTTIVIPPHVRRKRNDSSKPNLKKTDV